MLPQNLRRSAETAVLLAAAPPSELRDGMQKWRNDGWSRAGTTSRLTSCDVSRRLYRRASGPVGRFGGAVAIIAVVDVFRDVLLGKAPVAAGRKDSGEVESGDVVVRSGPHGYLGGFACNFEVVFGERSVDDEVGRVDDH